MPVLCVGERAHTAAACCSAVERPSVSVTDEGELDLALSCSAYHTYSTRGGGAHARLDPQGAPRTRNCVPYGTYPLALTFVLMKSSGGPYALTAVCNSFPHLHLV